MKKNIILTFALLFVCGFGMQLANAAEPNLLVNSGFEASGDWKTGFFTGSGKISRTTASKHSGSYAFMIDGSTSSSSGQVYGDTRNIVAVSAGSEYLYKAWYKGNNAYLVIKWLNASGTHFASHNFSLGNTTVWKEASVKAKAPTGAVKGWVFVQSRYNTNPVYFDDLFFAKNGTSPTLTPTATPTPTVNPTPTPTPTALPSPPPTPTSTPSPTPTITPTPTPTITPTPTPTATPTPTVNPTPTPNPNPANSILNPSLEEGTTGNPTDWFQGKWGTNTAVFSYPVSGSHGTKAAKVEVTSYTNGDAKWYFQDVAINPGVTYTISHDYNSTATSHVLIRYKLANGTESYQWLTELPASNGWKNHSAQFTPVTNAVSFTLFHYLMNVGALTIDNYILSNETPAPSSGGMITLSFDDGWLSHHQTVRPILNNASIKGTFYVNTVPPSEQWEGYMSWDQIRQMQSDGHEIGSHTRTHAHLPQLTDAQLVSEVKGSRDDLIANGITAPFSLAYPYGEKDARVVTAVKNAGYSAARGVEAGYNTSATDPYQLVIQEVDSGTTISEIKGWIDRAKADKTWLILMLHHVDNTGTAYGTTPQIFQQLVDYINQTQLKAVTIKQGVGLVQ